MDETFVFTIGSKVVCADGECGELRRIVVDPVARVLTHLVVRAEPQPGTGRLVPVPLVESVDDEAIHLRCGIAEFEKLDYAEATRFLEGARGKWPYEQSALISWPYFAIGGIASGPALIVTPEGEIDPRHATYERIPAGEVDIHRGEPVFATDGPIGHVQGLVVDPADHQVTHVLLDEGHLWGKKRVAIPVRFVSDVKAGVRVDLAKHDVRDLSPVDLDDGD